MEVVDLNIIMLQDTNLCMKKHGYDDIPFSDTIVSVVRASITSKLNIDGVGSGKGTFLSSSSRGVAIA